MEPENEIKPSSEKSHSWIVRMCHWMNLPIMAVMIWSGLLIYWANDVYKIQIGSWTVVKFFPEWFNNALGLKFSLAKGTNWHYNVMWWFTGVGVIYTVHIFTSKHWRQIVPTFRDLKAAPRYALQDMGLLRKKATDESATSSKLYNPMQRIVYFSVWLMGVLVISSGWAIYKPVRLNWLTSLHGGYATARLIHFMCMMGFVGFTVVHLLQVVRAGWNNFLSIIGGYKAKKSKPIQEQEATSEEPGDEPLIVTTPIEPVI